ncbi:MAG: ROK family protein [Candidatus Nanopelagicales bacterium]|nr:ROK family protein [Candidatus Nanopelagicales bacterium]
MRMIGGVESGGTKTVCVVGTDPETITSRTRIPTTSDPVETLGEVAEFFAAQCAAAGPLAAIGIGSFGPCDPNPTSPTYGYVTSTPKPGWTNTDVSGVLAAQMRERGIGEVPVVFDTDVNAAALGEQRFGAGRGVSSLVYLTVGTGIGGGAMIDGRLAHGLIHPEMGHIRIPRPAQELARFAGVCPFHGDCWEGVASGPAMAARWGQSAEDLRPDHPAWDLEAEYIASGLHALVCVLSPERIILGGGVGSVPHLLRRVRPRLVDSLAGYIASPMITERTLEYVVGPGLGNDSGVVGALALAQTAL